MQIMYVINNSNECAGTAVPSSHVGLPKTVKSEVNSQCHVCISMHFLLG